MKQLAPVIWTILAILVAIILTGSLFWVIIVGCIAAVVAVVLRPRGQVS